MPGKIYRFQYRVVYADCTLGNHVYHSRYLDILERARGEFFRDMGRTVLDWQNEDCIFPITEVQCQYKAPARYDDLLNIHVWLSQLTRLRVKVEHQIFLGPEQLILRATTHHVSTSREEKPKRMPLELAAQLEPFLIEPTAMV